MTTPDNRPGPLDGYRVLDLAHLLPGEFAAMWLGDLGADVVKIEPPATAALSRQRSTMLGPLDAALRSAVNRNKRSLTLDLKQQAAQVIMLKLAATADVVLEGFRPGVAARLGIDYATLREVNPRLVYCSISGYGQTGPDRDLPGHDINYLATAGILDANRRDAGPPHPLPVQIADIGGGAMPAVAAILAALLARHSTGTGQYIDLAMLDGSLAWTYFLQPFAQSPLYGGSYGVGMLGGEAACYNVYEASDGRYVSVGALEPKFWKHICEKLARPDLFAKGWLVGDEGAAVVAEMRAIFREHPLTDWLALFDPTQTCVAPVLSPAAALQDPQVVARGRVVMENGTAQSLFPALFSATPATYRRPAPEPGADSIALLREAGLTDTQVSELQSSGVV